MVQLPGFLEWLRSCLAAGVQPATIRAAIEAHIGILALCVVAVVCILWSLYFIEAPKWQGYNPLNETIDRLRFGPVDKDNLVERERKRKLRVEAEAKKEAKEAKSKAEEKLADKRAKDAKEKMAEQAKMEEKRNEAKKLEEKKKLERDAARAKTVAALEQARAIEFVHRDSLRQAEAAPDMTPAQRLELQKVQAAEEEKYREAVARAAVAQALTEQAYRIARREAADRVIIYRQAARAREEAWKYLVDEEDDVEMGKHRHLQIKPSIPGFRPASPGRVVAPSAHGAHSPHDPTLGSQKYGYAAQLLDMPLASPGSVSKRAPATPSSAALPASPSSAAKPTPAPTTPSSPAPAAATGSGGRLAERAAKKAAAVLSRGKAAAGAISSRLSPKRRLDSPGKEKVKAPAAASPSPEAKPAEVAPAPSPQKNQSITEKRAERLARGGVVKK